MNDIEFSRRVSNHVGDLYSEAKRSRRHFPKHSLIQTRALANLCCDILLGHGAQESPRALDEKIRMLTRLGRINPDTRELLDDLRRWGNAAAHPEDSLRDSPEFEKLADQALTVAINLLETVFRQLHGGADLPDYECVDDEPDELKEVCYRALIENGAADQYQVALLLRQRLKLEMEKIESAPDPFLQSYTRRLELGTLEKRELDLLSYASDANYVPARYQYGLALSEGRRGDDMVTLGVNLIAMAARDGDVDALAWRGHSILYGLHDEPVDYECARGFLERAAAEDQPLALSLLSRMYRDGLGVTPDVRAAYDLTLRAAQAGYPVAQYQTGEMLIRGEGVEPDQDAGIAWLRQASDAGLPEAECAVAKIVQHGLLPGGTAEAERLLTNAMRLRNYARLDLAEIYVSQTGVRQWLNALALLQAAYETALSEKAGELADRCRAAAPPVVAKVQASYGRMTDQERNDFILTRYLFDEYGRPYPNRSERMLKFANQAQEVSRLNGIDSQKQARLIGALASGIRCAPAAFHSPKVLAPIQQRVANSKVGRNENCACGSGKKSKRCCG